MTSPILLNHRSVLGISGDDAEPFLQGLLTCDVADMNLHERCYGALLTPQGKIIGDGILERTDNGFLFDCASEVVGDLVKRLNMFKLRADVSVDLRADLAVVAFQGAADPRSDAAATLAFVSRDNAEALGSDLTDYHQARIAAGLSEQAVDFSAGEVFPSDINMDLLNGIAFQKGCFVGQEVVSRMKRRGTARRRTVRVLCPTLAGADLTVEAALMAGEEEIGRVSSISGSTALARVRVDRVARAKESGLSVTFLGENVEIVYPDGLETADG